MAKSNSNGSIGKVASVEEARALLAAPKVQATPEPPVPAPVAATVAAPASAREALLASGPITIVIDGASFVASPRVFSSGSVGFNLSGRMPFLVDGKPTIGPDGKAATLVVSVNLTLSGSKPKA